MATSLAPTSLPSLAGTEPALVAKPASNWDRIAARQIELLLHGLGTRPPR